MEFLVTGASGFVARHLIPHLLNCGHKVVATSRTGNSFINSLSGSNLTFVPYDLSDEGKGLFDLFHRPDHLIHLAWEGLPNYMESFHVEDNLPRHLRFVQTLLDEGLRAMTVAGTCLEYGMKSGCLAESMAAEPTVPYAQAKDMLRRELERRTEKYGASLRWLRFFYLYGPGQSPRSLLPQLEAAVRRGDATFPMSPGDQVRDFLHIHEAAGQIAAIALQNEVTGVINCCSGSPTSVLDFVSRHIKANGWEITPELGVYPYADYEPKEFWGDTVKLRSAFERS
ncbi:NAD-dependent epimerase/dehydratase family protein [Paucidesulfovibrio longus]|uniref:NAD-dependent epimerase/dehydratase family protein n=1 Tax=Paucidesulfovibrio longus TaxID=889 RepID=UPI0003B47847|nr:NAD-dependent epimerase/dehydratase family protein [Paucidesulfovibrio longus]